MVLNKVVNMLHPTETKRNNMVNCPKCGKEAELMVHEKTEEMYWVCHDCKWTALKCEVWSRCVGYLRPVDSYNLGKKQEFLTRKTYKI